MANPALGQALADSVIRITFGLWRCWETPEYTKTRSNGILDQEVDKFGLLQAHVLERAARKFGVDLRLSKTPFAVLPGRHGHGLALRGSHGNPPRYISDVLASFQEAFPAVNHLFDIRLDSNGPWRLFEPMVNITDWDRWVNDGTKNRTFESKVVWDMASLLHRLEDEKIIALGRHMNATKTAEAMNWLAENLRSNFELFLDDIDHALQNSWVYLSRANEDARELRKKASADRTLYQAARTVIVGGSDSEAREAIIECRPAAEEIWGTATVSSIVPQHQTTANFVAIIWAAVQVAADRKSTTLKPGRLADNPTLELEKSQEAWTKDPRAMGINIPVDEICRGDFIASKDQLRRAFQRVLPPHGGLADTVGA